MSKREGTLEFHRERLDAIMRELWQAQSLDLHMCDGTTKTNHFGLLRNLREDIRVVRSALTRLEASEPEQ